MPIYGFNCEQCGRSVDLPTNVPFPCPYCRGVLQRVFTAPMVIIRGGVNSEIATDRMLNDFYKGQDEIKRGELTDTEIDVAREQNVRRCEKTGGDPGYFSGTPPTLTKKQMADKAKKQKKVIEDNLIQRGTK